METPEGVQHVPQKEYSACSLGFPVLQPILNKQEGVRLGNVGYAPSQFFKAASLLKAVKEATAETPDFLLCHRPECEACTNRRAFLKQMGRIK
jgi:TPP-dependent indolepyruvate ferredoxin oxidoreductase alpha subunit